MLVDKRALNVEREPGGIGCAKLHAMLLLVGIHCPEAGLQTTSKT